MYVPLPPPLDHPLPLLGHALLDQPLLGHLLGHPMIESKSKISMSTKILC